MRVFSAEPEPTNPAIIRFNIDGQSVFVDFTSVVKGAETDTSLTADAIARVLNYVAEKHTDTIAASELGAILHLADIGDVDISNVGDNSLLVYQKDADCGEGCEGINNSWVGWNAEDNLTTSMQYVMGFDEDGAPQSLNHPTNTDQYYLLGWNAADKVSYTQPIEATSPPLDDDGYAYRLYLDPTTKQIVYVREETDATETEETEDEE